MHVEKLSAKQIQQRLVEADTAKKASYETAKRPKTSKGEVSHKAKPGDLKPTILRVKQVEANGLQATSDSKGKPFVNQSERADKISDSIKTPTIFSAKSGTSGNPPAPKAEKKTPNQTTKPREVKADMSRSKDASKNSQYYKQAPGAAEIVDAMPRGKIFSEGDGVPTVKAPKPKDLGGTTRPKSKEVAKPKMGTDPTREPKANPMSFSKQGMPSDAPKKPSWEKVKSGVVVRVNEKRKAEFDIVSSDVLTKLVEQYQRFGYKVVVEHTEKAAWKTDKLFLTLLRETIEAKLNFVPKFFRECRASAFKRFHELTRKDYNSLYESRERFLTTLREAFEKIEEIAEQKLRDRFEVFDGKARVILEGKLNEVDMITEASDHQMALRQFRNSIMENFGLGTEIVHIFVDGKKYSASAIQEWAPKAVK